MVRQNDPAGSRLLAMDIGAGTQDIIVNEPGRPPENCPQLVLPSPSVIIAGRIARQTAAGRAVHLDGRLMGGGPLTAAARAHLGAGLPLSASPDAARTLHDDPAVVSGWGVRITAEAPAGSAVIRLADVDRQALATALAQFDIELPSLAAVAVQDHGESPGKSNRRFRFEHWEAFLGSGGQIRDLVYDRDIPPYLTRMRSVRECWPGALVMDTGAASLWGALGDPVVAGHLGEGITLVNLGNAHALAFLLDDCRVWGIFEHHTGLLDRHRLASYIARLRDGTLTNNEVFGDGGHGCAVEPARGRFAFVAVTGPNRALARGLGWHEAAPYGNMMLAGAFGLLEAARAVGYIR